MKVDGLWDAAFAKKLGALEQLAEEALQEHHAERTRPLEPDALWHGARRPCPTERWRSGNRTRWSGSGSAPTRTMTSSFGGCDAVQGRASTQVVDANE